MYVYIGVSTAVSTDELYRKYGTAPVKTDASTDPGSTDLDAPVMTELISEEEKVFV
jgi:hypothetical protein